MIPLTASMAPKGKLGIEVGEDDIQILTNVWAKSQKGQRRLRSAQPPPPSKFSLGELALGACVNGLERLRQTHRTAKLSDCGTEVFT
jgi:hypothetical protein